MPSVHFRGASGDEEVAALRVLVDGAEARLHEGALRREAPRAAAAAKIEKLDEETAERLEEAAFDRIMAELRAGQEGPTADLERAASFQKKRWGLPTQRAARPGRRCRR